MSKVSVIVLLKTVINCDFILKCNIVYMSAYVYLFFEGKNWISILRQKHF